MVDIDPCMLPIHGRRQRLDSVSSFIASDGGDECGDRFPSHAGRESVSLVRSSDSSARWPIFHRIDAAVVLQIALAKSLDQSKYAGHWGRVPRTVKNPSHMHLAGVPLGLGSSQQSNPFLIFANGSELCIVLKGERRGRISSDEDGWSFR